MGKKKCSLPLPPTHTHTHTYAHAYKYTHPPPHTHPSLQVHNHCTGVRCGCGGELLDTIINFNEFLHPEVTSAASALSAPADLVLVLGSSMRVVTTEAFKDVQANGGALVVVNLQKTPYDKAARLRVFAECDELMGRVMALLDLPIPRPACVCATHGRGKGTPWGGGGFSIATTHNGLVVFENMWSAGVDGRAIISLLFLKIMYGGGVVCPLWGVEAYHPLFIWISLIHLQ